ncbi:hypothetical protein [Luteococcus peritonei]|uniref:Gram-positive cocci surface proteins LPxTG domain-containing protein n=1 Tax=Luteococcus peritonei TaxID=88874 RepID=A0ABW4RS36_9ACTN
MQTLRTALATTAALAALASAPLAAQAAPMNDATDCLDQGKVWLAIQDSKGELLVNRCVEKAATGSQLLTDAGVKVTKDAKGFVCAMEGEPATCPAKFDGNYWHYWLGTKDGGWKMSEKGADNSVPAAGTLEGWCYGKECSMPAVASLPAATDASASPSASAEATAPAGESKGTPWGVITTVAVLALAAIAGLVLARRRKA